MTRLSAFITDPGMLVSTGTVTIFIRDANGETPIELPITTAGMLELRMKMDMMKPVAPKKAIVIKAESEIGEQLNLREDTVKLVQDDSDEGYLNKVDEYQTDYVWRVVLNGLDMEFTNKTGKVVTEFEEKRAILITNGIDSTHLSSIFTALVTLSDAHDIDLDAYIQRSIGISKAIKNKIISRSKKIGGKDNPGPLYNDVRLMAEYNLTPKEFETTHPIDRKALNYSLMMKYHIDSEQIEKQKRMAKLEKNKQKVTGSLPTFSRGGR